MLILYSDSAYCLTSATVLLQAPEVVLNRSLGSRESTEELELEVI